MACRLSILTVLLVGCQPDLERPVGWYGGDQQPNIGPGVLIGGGVQYVHSYPSDFISSDYPIWKLDRSAYVGALGYTTFSEPFDAIKTTPCFDPEGRAGAVVNGQLVVLSAWGAPWATWDTGGSGGIQVAADADGTWLVPASDHLKAVSSDGHLVYDVDVGGFIAMQPAIGLDGSVALALTGELGSKLVVLEADGSLRGSADLPIDPVWLGRVGDELVVAEVVQGYGSPTTTAIVALDADTLAVRWDVTLPGTGTGLSLYGDGDVVVAASGATSDGLGVMVRLAASDGAEQARAEMPWSPGAPSLDGDDHLWVACDVGVCTYDRNLGLRDELIPYDEVLDGLPQAVSVAIDDGWVGVAQAEGYYAAWPWKGVKAPTRGWSRRGGGPAGAGRELGR